MGLRELFVALVALLCLGLGLLLLEQPRTGLEIAPIDAGAPVATALFVPGAEAPVVVLAPDRAAARQAMFPLAQTLARAGYVAVVFDRTAGGDPQADLSAVIEAALALPESDGRLALVGHG
ncbi:alpha/beta hydrolase, partial [Rhodobacterales bacterium HKCCE2091]|nr:alpha/beta hydrolase [Rhodobacterales bacterium HKCCE2091]